MTTLTARNLTPKAARTVTEAMPTLSTKKDKVLTLEDHAKKYMNLVAASKTKLKTLRAIGVELVLIRVEFKKIDLNGVVTYDEKGYGAAVKATELKVMSTHDRGDALWLALNWGAIEAFKAKKGLESQSITYLRKMIRKAANKLIADEELAYAEELARSNTAKGIKTEPVKPEGKGTPGVGIEPKTMSDVELVEHMLALCETNGLAPKAIAVMFSNAAKKA